MLQKRAKAESRKWSRLLSLSSASARPSERSCALVVSAVMRVLLLATLLASIACEQAAQPVVIPSPVATDAPRCEPTIARMVPPQSIMDVSFGGMIPRPSATPTREAWAARENWIGNDALWIALPPNGVFERKYHKLFMIALKGGPITIAGRRLDGDGSDRSGMFWAHATSDNIGSSVTFAKSGCWELTYELAGEQLRFTLDVVG